MLLGYLLLLAEPRREYRCELPTVRSDLEKRYWLRKDAGSFCRQMLVSGAILAAGYLAVVYCYTPFLLAVVPYGVFVLALLVFTGPAHRHYTRYPLRQDRRRAVFLLGSVIAVIVLLFTFSVYLRWASLPGGRPAYYTIDELHEHYRSLAPATLGMSEPIEVDRAAPCEDGAAGGTIGMYFADAAGAARWVYFDYRASRMKQYVYLYDLPFWDRKSNPA